VILEGSPRTIFVAAPFVPDSPLLAKLEARFETSDGQPRHPELTLSLLTQAVAMVNADQDSPGFWDDI